MASLFSGHAGRLAGMWAAQAAQMAQADLDRRIGEGKTQALDALTQRYDSARGSYGDAVKLFEPYVQVGQKGLDLLTDSLGMNGSDGYDRAVDAFHTSPGFQKRVDLATDAVARKASATGALGSGNTLQAMTDRAYDLGNQEYSGWQDRLTGLGQLGYGATGQQANLTKGIGDLWAGQGQGEAGVIQNATGMGVNAAQNTANTVIGAGTGALMAGQQAQANGWGALLGGANMLANGIGSAFGSRNSWLPALSQMTRGA